MQKINNIAELKATMFYLESKQAKEWELINEHLLVVRDSLSPIHLLKRSFSEVFFSPQVKESLVGTVAGLAAGTVSRALIVGATHNPFKILFGALLQMKVSNTVAKNAGTIGFVANQLVKLFGKKEKNKEPLTFHSNPQSNIF